MPKNYRLVRDKEHLLIGVLRALINTIDAKDSYTCGHSDRWPLVARCVGKELQLSLHEQSTLYLSRIAPRHRQDRRTRCGAV